MSSISNSLAMAGISSVLKLPGAVGRVSDTRSLSCSSQIVDQEGTKVTLTGVGTFLLNWATEKGFSDALTRHAKLKLALPLITILPMYVLMEYVSRLLFPVADAIREDVNKAKSCSKALQSSAFSPFQLQNRPKSLPLWYK